MAPFVTEPARIHLLSYVSSLNGELAGWDSLIHVSARAAIMRLRHTSIRLRMLLLVLVPLAALILVYGYSVAGQVSTAVGLANAGKISGTTIKPVTDALVALNQERTGAIQYLAASSSQTIG